MLESGIVGEASVRDLGTPGDPFNGTISLAIRHGRRLAADRAVFACPKKKPPPITVRVFRDKAPGGDLLQIAPRRQRRTPPDKGGVLG